MNNSSNEWRADSLTEAAFFADLVALIRPQRFTDWPGIDALNALLPERARTAGGRQLRFTADASAGSEGALAYERRTGERGEIGLKPRNWHDLFNAFAWALWPATRAAISEAHLEAGAGEAGRRPPRRDALTLFDECGIVIASAEPRLRAMHEAHRWRELFVSRRNRWGTRAVAMILGHGLCEQCLTPYPGLTAKALYLDVTPAWFGQPLAVRYRQADAELARGIASGSLLRSTAELLPLPVLGIPGWWPANSDPGWYENEKVFRPARHT